MNIKCYGWVPILTSYLIAENLHVDPSKIFPRESSDTDDSQKIDGSLQFDNRNYLTSISLDIPEIAHLNITCNIESTGLVYFYFDRIDFSPDPQENLFFNNKILPNWVFDIIRDSYHDHVHHGKDNDCKLSHVVAKTRDEAIRRILNQYQNKIIEYHKDFKSISDRAVLFPMRLFKSISKKRMYFLTTGCGEFTYAQSFINLHRDEIDSMRLDYEMNNHSFILAKDSVSTLKDKLSWKIMHRTSIAAICIAIISLIIASGLTYDNIKDIWHLGKQSNHSQGELSD